jgi:transcriptional regulator with XRE-family HTH domain
MDPTDRFHEASSMLEGCRQGLTTFADVRLGALRELERYGYNRQQIADATGLSRQRIEQLLKDR